MKVVFLAVMLATPACASVPLLVPTRDVTVTYSVHPRDHAPLQVRVSIAAGGARLRITAEDIPTAFLVDRREHVATILLPMLKMFTTVKIGDYDPQESVLRGAHFERHGSETIAGRVCTVWSAVSAQGIAGACVTEDGVILRGHAANHHGELGSVMASTVEYGRLPPELFERPRGFTNAGSLPVAGLSGFKQ
jgi:hypothetical protein